MDGSGSGKSASYVIPNAYQLLGSYVFTDPKGELYDKTAGYLREQGYDIKILNLVKYHMHHLYIIKNLPFAKTGEMIKNVDLNDMILMFVSDRLGRGQVEKEKKLNEIEDIEEVIRILERNYDLDLKEIKEKIQKIKKFI